MFLIQKKVNFSYICTVKVAFTLVPMEMSKNHFKQLSWGLNVLYKWKNRVGTKKSCKTVTLNDVQGDLCLSVLRSVNIT